MQIKIGDKIYNSKEEPIMVILSDKDKENIAIWIEIVQNIVVFQILYL
jgi:predicted house-cleaning noncanonical NTP pyrophosphatase (MazG superfamily)